MSKLTDDIKGIFTLTHLHCQNLELEEYYVVLEENGHLLWKSKSIKDANPKWPSAFSKWLFSDTTIVFKLMRKRLLKDKLIGMAEVKVEPKDDRREEKITLKNGKVETSMEVQFNIACNVDSKTLELPDNTMIMICVNRANTEIELHGDIPTPMVLYMIKNVRTFVPDHKTNIHGASSHWSFPSDQGLHLMGIPQFDVSIIIIRIVKTLMQLGFRLCKNAQSFDLRNTPGAHNGQIDWNSLVRTAELKLIKTERPIEIREMSPKLLFVKFAIDMTVWIFKFHGVDEPSVTKFATTLPFSSKIEVVKNKHGEVGKIIMRPEHPDLAANLLVASMKNLNRERIGQFVLNSAFNFFGQMGYKMATNYMDNAVMVKYHDDDKPSTYVHVNPTDPTFNEFSLNISGNVADEEIVELTSRVPGMTSNKTLDSVGKVANWSLTIANNRLPMMVGRQATAWDITKRQRFGCFTLRALDAFAELGYGVIVPQGDNSFVMQKMEMEKGTTHMFVVPVADHIEIMGPIDNNFVKGVLVPLGFDNYKEEVDDGYTTHVLNVPGIGVASSFMVAVNMDSLLEFWFLRVLDVLSAHGWSVISSNGYQGPFLLQWNRNNRPGTHINVHMFDSSNISVRGNIGDALEQEIPKEILAETRKEMRNNHFLGLKVSRKSEAPTEKMIEMQLLTLLAKMGYQPKVQFWAGNVMFRPNK
eukprot:TRINITY_DN3878_c0_g1_i1.p1 TRINITY_DN3878_c0_g1~~TRINITY_DN3878_c0_g1_i1.p1  ORF type:complete len:698 (-),score=179.38 TRINITY_DN3878_c0_g1_i1:26-2119(-)